MKKLFKSKIFWIISNFSPVVLIYHSVFFLVTLTSMSYVKISLKINKFYRLNGNLNLLLYSKAK